MVRNTFTLAVLLFLPLFAWAQPLVLSEGEARYLQVLSGDNFQDRAEVIVSTMAAMDLPTENLSLKYLGPFAFAKLKTGQDVQAANAAIGAMLEVSIRRIKEHGSHTHFNAHAGMHGFLLSQGRFSAANEAKLRTFLSSLSVKEHARGTINMSSMVNGALFLAAEQWADFSDKDGLSSSEIREICKASLMHMLESFYVGNNCEMDAFTYFSTNLPWVRMLAEYAEDEQLRAAAAAVYQKMLATTIAPWNRGNYIASPYRSKGWHNLLTSRHTMQAITHLGWLLYGNDSNEAKFIKQIGGGRASLPNTLFWVAYPGRVMPLTGIFRAEQRQAAPYVYRSRIDGSEATLYKYTYQSESYGLASQIEVHTSLAEATKRYGYKELKRTFLEWQSPSKDCVFSVCQDNPARPRDLVNRNPVGYGENPFHRVLQHEGALIGVYQVPEDYLNGDRYQLYVPFTRAGIIQRIERQGWVFCHAGSMLFAFRTLEPYEGNQAIFEMEGYDMLSMADAKQRSGSWVLQTSEITPEFKRESPEAELNAFVQAVLTETRLVKADSYSVRPKISYRSLSGVELELEYFPPTENHSGQFRVGGNPLDLGRWPLLSAPSVSQKGDTVHLNYEGGGEQISFPR
ncbi:MAG: T9SS C-terminal target domain-containing protein [Verrucomicrobiota bacterium]